MPPPKTKEGIPFITISNICACAPVPLVVEQPVITNVPCSNGHDGSIDIEPSGGSLPYSYLWSNGAITQDIDSLTPGNYCITITDNNTCTISSCWLVGQSNCDILNLQNLSIAGTVCYSAAQTVIVAGPPPTFQTNFHVMNQGHVTIIAGQNIIFYPGTVVYPGGYLCGHIAPIGPFCMAPMLPQVLMSKEDPISFSERASFNVYPNPTHGKFTIELSSEPNGNPVFIKCFNMMGSLIIETEIRSGRKQEISLDKYSSGIYLIQVIQNEEIETGKILKQMSKLIILLKALFQILVLRT